MRARLQRLSRALPAIIFAIVAHSCTGSSSINVTSPSGAPKCQVAVTNSMASAPAAGASGTLTVATTRDCTWSAFSSAPWVTLTSNTSGQGEGSIGYAVAPNADPAPRHTNVQVNDVALVVTQEAAPCKFVVSAPNTAVSASGGTIAVGVETKTGCSWTAASQADWITIANGKTGNGSGTVTIAVAANPATAGRAGVVVVAGEAVTISEAGVPPVVVTPPPTAPAPPPPTPTPPAPAPPPEPAPAPTPGPTPTPTPCTYALGAAGASIAAAGGSGGVSVTAGAGCAWTAVSSVSWITITGGSSGSGNGQVAYRVAANTEGDRSGTLTIAGKTYTVSQSGAACSWNISPTSQSMTDAGGSGTVTVTLAAGAGCSWTATSNAQWLTITSSASGSANGSVTFSASANTGAARSGTLTVGGKTFTVNQSAPACSYSLSPTSQSVDPGGGNGTIAVTAGPGCAWTATPSAPWISITSATSGTGSGSVTFSVAANTGAARSGTIAIDSQTFTVTQAAAAAPCTFSIAPTSQSVSDTGGSGSVAVTTGPSCTWTAAANDSWISITSGASGTGNGTVAFSVAQNTGAARSGTATIAGQTFTVSQAAPPAPPPCTFSIAPTTQSVPASGGAGTITLTASSASCAWTASSNASWLAITSAASGTGSSSVTFTAAANSGAARSGTLTIAGQTFTANQGGQ